MKDQEILNKHGWEIECESPFEIRHFDGSFATGSTACTVLECLREIPPTISIKGIVTEHIIGKKIVDFYVENDGEIEDLIILMEDGKQIEIYLHDDGYILVQTD